MVCLRNSKESRAAGRECGRGARKLGQSNCVRNLGLKLFTGEPLPCFVSLLVRKVDGHALEPPFRA